MALLGCANQGAALAAVSNKEVKLSLVNHKLSCQSFAIRLAALGELTDDGTSLVAVFGEPHLGLLLESDNGLANLEGFQEALVN